jgi:porin
MPKNLAELGPVPFRNSEYVVETYYPYRPLNGLEVRPNIQYAIDPGGTSQNQNALVFGLKTGSSISELLTVPASLQVDNTFV